jgi:hypothetical protein
MATELTAWQLAEAVLARAVVIAKDSATSCADRLPAGLENHSRDNKTTRNWTVNTCRQNPAPPMLNLLKNRTAK